MEIISFQSIKNHHKFKETFNYLSAAKANSDLDEKTLTSIMGSFATSHFMDPSEENSLDLQAWKDNPDIQLRWDFGSWFEALESAEIAYINLTINDKGSGKIEFEQLAWPSGGIEATEELIKAFGGIITSNSLIDG